MITNEKLDELIHYYKISKDFLEKVKENSTENATKEDLKKLDHTHDLFSNTLIALNELKITLVEKKEETN